MTSVISFLISLYSILQMWKDFFSKFQKRGTKHTHSIYTHVLCLGFSFSFIIPFEPELLEGRRSWYISSTVIHSAKLLPRVSRKLLEKQKWYKDVPRVSVVAVVRFFSSNQSPQDVSRRHQGPSYITTRLLVGPDQLWTWLTFQTDTGFYYTGTMCN